jgi:hypothetical protein
MAKAPWNADRRFAKWLFKGEQPPTTDRGPIQGDHTSRRRRDAGARGEEDDRIDGRKILADVRSRLRGPGNENPGFVGRLVEWVHVIREVDRIYKERRAERDAAGTTKSDDGDAEMRRTPWAPDDPRTEQTGIAAGSPAPETADPLPPRTPYSGPRGRSQRDSQEPFGLSS